MEDDCCGCPPCQIKDSCKTTKTGEAQCAVKYNVIGQRLCPCPFKFPDKCTAKYNVISQKVYVYDPECPCYPSRPTGYNLTCSYADPGSARDTVKFS